jgi:hypothetical protein
MHLAKRVPDKDTSYRRMRESGPIGTGYLAASDGVAPQRTHAVFAACLGELIDRETMSFVKRLVQQFGSPVVPSGEAYRGTVQFVIGVLRRRKPKLLQKLTQLSRGQARADDGAMQTGVEFPDFRATRWSPTDWVSFRATNAAGNDEMSIVLGGDAGTAAARITTGALSCSPAAASGLQARLGNELRIEIVLDCFQPAFGAIAGILHATERHFGQCQAVVVDRDHAALDGGSDGVRSLGRPCIRVRRKSVRQTVGFLHHIVE